MSPIKLAVLALIGPLDKFGYQHIYKPIIANISGFATKVYIISSARSRNGVDEILNLFPNVVYISDERTWLPVNENQEEVYRIMRPAENANLFLDIARSDGMDCATIFAVNQYLPEENWENYIADCADMIEKKEPFRWQYKRVQLGNRLFWTDRRIPHILNLHYPNPVKIDIDSIRLPETGGYYRSTLGDYRDKSSISTVDVPREMTPQELEDLRCFIRNYDEINPGVDPTFVWERDGWREVKKYSAKQFSTDPLSPTGQIIARNSRPDFVSQYLLKAHPENAPWHVKIGRSMKSRLDIPSLRQNVVQQLKRIKQKMIGKNSE